MDIPGRILIIASHSTQGSQGPAGEPGIQVSGSANLWGTENPACWPGGNYWKTILIRHCFLPFPGSSRPPWVARNSGEWCKDSLGRLLPHNLFNLTCPTVRRCEHVSVFRELQEGMGCQACQALQVTRYVNRLPDLCAFNTPRSQTAYQASFAGQTN